MAWKTHLVMFFGTGDGKPSKIEKRIEKLGFTTALGPVDFIYEWKVPPTKNQVLKLADRVAIALKGTGSVFNIDTHD